MTSACLSASTRGYLMSIDARCPRDDEEGRLVITSGDSIGIRIELSDGDVLTREPIAAAWQAFDYRTRQPITEATPVDPSADMMFIVRGLLHDDSDNRARRTVVQVVVQFDDEGDDLTMQIEVWVRRRMPFFGSQELAVEGLGPGVGDLSPVSPGGSFWTPVHESDDDPGGGPGGGLGGLSPIFPGA